MRTNRREFLMLAAAAPAAFPPAGARAASPKGDRPTGKALWHNRPIRIYHPNVREFELENLDVKGFVGACGRSRGDLRRVPHGDREADGLRQRARAASSSSATTAFAVRSLGTQTSDLSAFFCLERRRRIMLRFKAEM